MKSFDYYAVVYDGSVYCTGCIPEPIDPDLLHPIFADSEWDYVPTCDHCGERHDYVTIIHYGKETCHATK